MTNIEFYATSKGYSDTVHALEKRAAGKVKWSHIREALQLATVPVSVWGAAEMLKQQKLQKQEMAALESLGKHVGYDRGLRAPKIRKRRIR